MRVGFDNYQSKSIGLMLGGFLRSYAGIGGETQVRHKVLRKVESRFHGGVSNASQYAAAAIAQEQEFVSPLWSIFSGVSFTDEDEFLNPESKPASVRNDSPIIAVVPGFKEAPDFIVEANSIGEALEVPAVHLEKGGLASNMAEAFIKFGYSTDFIPLIGNGYFANLHTDSMLAAGLDVEGAIVDPNNDGYLHTCVLFSEDGGDAQEYWMAQYRKQFSAETIDSFTEAIRSSCKRNPNIPLVLSAIPPAGAGDDYFSRLITIAEENGNPTIYNPKEYDPNKMAFMHMFNQKQLGYIKPNLVEFVEFLQYSGIVEDSSLEKRNEIVDRLKKQIESDDFSETIELARKFINAFNPEMTVFLSYGKHGSMAINRHAAVLTTAPQIPVGCSSGAGDSGLAAIITRAHELKLDFKSNLHFFDLGELTTAFVRAASATAQLPGNQIATRRQVEAVAKSHIPIIRIQTFS